MYASLMQIAPNVLEELKNDPAFIEGLKEEGSLELSLDKAWHGIHFILTGETKRGETPLSKAIMGGRAVEQLADIDLNDDLYLGYHYYLTAEEVRQTANALSQISTTEFKARFSPDAMIEADIYPNIWDRGDAKTIE